MGGRRHYHRKHAGAQAAYNHISDRIKLSQDFGGIDKDIEKIFLELPESKLHELLAAYEVNHGKKAADYARDTMPRWRNGQTKMSGQTASRLIELVPPFLSTDARFYLTKKLRQHYMHHKRIRISASPENWRELATEALDSLISSNHNNKLPSSIIEKATWLSNGDSVAALHLLATSDQELAHIRLSHIQQEMNLIQGMLSRAEQRGNIDIHIEHTISIPQGSVEIVIEHLAPTLLQKIMQWIGL